MVGSDRREVLAAVEDVQPEAVPPVAFAADHRFVTIGAGDGRGSVLLVRFALERTTRVAGGENARRTLQDANAVESLASLGNRDGSLPRFALEPPAAGEGIAVLVQAVDGRMLGAAVYNEALGKDMSDPRELRKLAAWYRELAEGAANPAFWEAQLITAEALEREASRLERRSSQHRSGLA
jgi:hypothetical protein